MTKNLTCVVLTFLVFTLAGAAAVFAGTASRLQAPTLLSPVNYTVFENVPRSTMVVWSPIAGADGYTVTLEYSPTGAKGSFTPVGSPFSAPDAAYQFDSSVLDATGDGHYEWYVIAVGDGVTHSSSKPSTPMYFSYSTTVVLPVPMQISPTDGAQFYNTNPRQATLAWVPSPAASGGYNVFVESYDSTTEAWAPVSGSPFSVPATPTWQNSSYNFTASAAGEFRWAVQAVGDGVTTIDSLAPTDSKQKEWNRFTFEK